MKADDDLTPDRRKRRKYEREKRGPVVMRVQLSGSEGEEAQTQWKQIRDGLKAKYGSAKQGIFELAKKDGLLK